MGRPCKGLRAVDCHGACGGCTGALWRPFVGTQACVRGGQGAAQEAAAAPAALRRARARGAAWAWGRWWGAPVLTGLR
jgi:hypothetical protein